MTAIVSAKGVILFAFMKSSFRPPFRAVRNRDPSAVSIALLDNGYRTSIEGCLHLLYGRNRPPPQKIQKTSPRKGRPTASNLGTGAAFISSSFIQMKPLRAKAVGFAHGLLHRKTKGSYLLKIVLNSSLAASSSACVSDFQSIEITLIWGTGGLNSRILRGVATSFLPV